MTKEELKSKRDKFIEVIVDYISNEIFANNKSFGTISSNYDHFVPLDQNDRHTIVKYVENRTGLMIVVEIVDRTVSWTV